MGGALPIPFTSIDRYARRYSIADIDQFDGFAALIHLMDGAYLKWAAGRAKREKDQQ